MIVLILYAYIGQQDYVFNYYSLGCILLEPSLKKDILNITNGFISMILILLLFCIICLIKRNKSKMTYRYFVVALFYSLFMVFSTGFWIWSDLYKPTSVYDRNQFEMEITSIFIKAATGVVTGISRLWNKRLFQELKWKLKLMITCKRKRKNNYIQKESLESFCESQSIENFEDISKESLTQLLIMIYLRFSLDAQTIQVEHEGDYDEYIFSKKNFQTLSQELGLHSIYESYIPCLCLIEYFPSLFEEIRQDLKFQSNFFRSFTLQENLAKLVRIKQNHKNFQEFPVFFTSDKKFVIKSINSSERNFLLNHLEQYKNKIKKNSFLVRIVALFQVEHVKADFIIMENTVRKAGKALRFQINDWNEIRETSFELHCPRYGELFDYSELVNSRLKINIGSSQCFETIRKIEDDLKFLNSFKATGYSIMVCFYQPGIKVDSRYVVEGVFENYEISIIGIWKEFGFWRRIEMIFKKMIKKNQDYLDVDPKEYSERLLKIFSDLINDVGV